MQLRDHLSAEKVSIPDFARAIGVSVQTVHRYLSGERIPRPEIMQKIKAATDGKVQPNDFFAEAA
jgi:transcriptional regulator with XRE-family HTH domain